MNVIERLCRYKDKKNDKKYYLFISTFFSIAHSPIFNVAPASLANEDLLDIAGEVPAEEGPDIMSQKIFCQKEKKKKLK